MRCAGTQRVALCVGLSIKSVFLRLKPSLASWTALHRAIALQPSCSKLPGGQGSATGPVARGTKPRRTNARAARGCCCLPVYHLLAKSHSRIQAGLRARAHGATCQRTGPRQSKGAETVSRHRCRNLQERIAEMQTCRKLETRRQNCRNCRSAEMLNFWRNEWQCRGLRNNKITEMREVQKCRSA